MIASNKGISHVFKYLYIALPLLFIGAFILQSIISQLTPLNNLIASSNTFPAAQFNNSPIGFELYQESSQNNNATKHAITTYVSRGNNYALFLTPSEAVVTLSDLQTKNSKPAVLHMQYVGASKTATISGIDNFGSKSHYFMGNDPSKWKTNIPRFEKVQYKNLYPGIDLLFYGNQNELEYDFIVAPNINPNIIRLNFSDAENLTISRHGDLLIQTRVGQILQKKPVIYQNKQNDNLNDKRYIDGSYVILSDNTIGFNIGDYDHNLPLIIDPVLEYAIYIGGSDQDSGTRIAVDTEGYIYITGFTFSSDYPSGALLGSNISSFVTKLTPDGSNVVFSIYLGGSGNDRGRDIAISDEGDIYVAGETTSTDFPVLASAPQSQNNGDSDAFLSVISSDGTHLHYSTYLGGSGFDAAHGLAIGNNNQVYIAGETWSNDLPTTTDTLDDICGTGTSCVTNKNYDAFFTVVDLLENNLVYSTYLGGSGDDKAHAVAADLNTGYGYIVGESNSSEFPRKKSILPILGFKGDHLEGFLTVIDPTLNNRDSLIFSSLIGGQNEDVVDSISVDANGNAYLFGYTNSIDFPVKNPYQAFLRGNTDSFIAKINPTAANGPEALVYSTYLGGSGAELSYGVAVDDLNRTYIVGTTSSIDFPTVAAFQNENAGGVDAFVATLSPDGDALQYASYLGGSGNETGSGIAVSADGTAYIVGDSVSSSLPASTSILQIASDANNDSINAFIAKVTPPPLQQNAAKPSSGGGANSPAFIITLMLLLTLQLTRRK